MESFFTLRQAHKNAIEAFEQETGHAVRIVDNHGRMTLDDFGEFDGITVISYGIPLDDGQEPYWQTITAIPQGVAAPGYAGEYEIYDTYTTRSTYAARPRTAGQYPDRDISPLWTHSEMDGEQFPSRWVAPKTVVFGFGLKQWLGVRMNLSNKIDTTKFLIDDMRACMAPDFAENQERLFEERNRARMIDWARGGRDRMLIGLRTEVTTLEHQHSTTVEQLAAFHKQLQEKRSAIQAAAAAISLTPEETQDMFDQVLAHPRIEKYEFTNNEFVIFTDMVTMKHPDFGDRTLGRFRIAIGLQDGMHGLTFKNLDYPRNGRHAPHIPETGKACWGTVGPVVAKYLGEMKLIPLIEMLFMYLETVDPNDDWGEFAAMWYDHPDPLTEAETAETHDAEAVAA